jgi:hypothetical protein
MGWTEAHLRSAGLIQFGVFDLQNARPRRKVQLQTSNGHHPFLASARSTPKMPFKSLATDLVRGTVRHYCR